MTKEKIYFTIEVYEKTKPLFPVKESEFEFGRVVSGSLPFRDAVEAMKVVEIGDWEHFKILRYDGSEMFGKVVVVSMELKDWEAKKRSEAERALKNKELRAELIAKLPADHVIYELTRNCGEFLVKITLNVTTEYSAKISSQIKYYTTATLTVFKNKAIVKEREIHLWDYRTRGGNLRRKHWASDVDMYIPEEAGHLRHVMKNDLKDILTAKSEVVGLYNKIATRTLYSRPFGSDKEWTIVVHISDWIKKMFSEEAMEILARTGLISWYQGECQLEYKLGVA